MNQWVTGCVPVFDQHCQITGKHRHSTVDLIGWPPRPPGLRGSKNPPHGNQAPWNPPTSHSSIGEKYLGIRGIVPVRHIWPVLGRPGKQRGTRSPHLASRMAARRCKCCNEGCYRMRGDVARRSDDLLPWQVTIAPCSISFLGTYRYRRSGILIAL